MTFASLLELPSRAAAAVVLASVLSVAGCADSSDASSSGHSSSGSGDIEAVDRACHAYEPGERGGGADFSSFLTREQLEDLDLRIQYPDAPIAAIDAYSVYVPQAQLLRTTFTGLVKVNRTEPSTALRFNDFPLKGLGASSFAVTMDSAAVTPSRVTCTGEGQTPISVVFLVDVTGSMSPVIAAVRDSLLDFVQSATSLGLDGKIGVVTFQDAVGVNIPFEDCSGVSGPIPERSPFFPPVSLKDAAGVARLRDFIAKLHADDGGDAPENLAAAIDFAANNVIGKTKDGRPNVIGDGIEDPPYTSAWPAHELDGLTVLIPITDSTFHESGSRSSYLRAPWRPRPIDEIVTALGNKIVSTIDPALVDAAQGPGPLPEEVDADFWAQATGGFGVDRHRTNVFGLPQTFSLFDLELLVLGRGLLEIPLAPALAATCVLEMPATSAPSEVVVDVTHPEGSVRYVMKPTIATH